MDTNADKDGVTPPNSAPAPQPPLSSPQPGQQIQPQQPLVPPAAVQVQSVVPKPAPVSEPAVSASPAPAPVAAPIVTSDVGIGTPTVDVAAAPVQASQAAQVSPLPSVPVSQPAPQTVAAVPPQLTPREPGKASAATGLLRKYWYVAAGVVILFAGLSFMQIRHVSQENAWKQATQHYQASDYEAAAKEIGKLGMPSDPERLRVYAQTMLATRQLDAALEAYAKLYEAKKDPSVRLIMGNIYTEQKNTAEATKVYRELIDSNPKYVQAYINLATLDRQQGRADEARKVAEAAVAANPTSVALYQLRVSTLLDKKGSAEYNAALDGLRGINPDDPLLLALQ